MVSTKPMLVVAAVLFVLPMTTVPWVNIAGVFSRITVAASHNQKCAAKRQREDSVAVFRNLSLARLVAASAPLIQSVFQEKFALPSMSTCAIAATAGDFVASPTRRTMHEEQTHI